MVMATRAKRPEPMEMDAERESSRKREVEVGERVALMW